MPTTHRTTINLPLNLAKSAKLHALHHNQTLTQLIIDSLHDKLSLAKPTASLHSVLESIAPPKKLPRSQRDVRYTKHLKAKYG